VTKAKIFIVDDHPLVREWLTTLVDQTSELKVCGGAADAKAALEGIARLKPDVAIIDLSLGEDSGLNLIRTIAERFPKVASVVLSMHDERVYAERSIRAGARGYVMKRDSTKKVIEAIQHVLAGNLYLTKEMTELFAQRFVASGADRDLSPAAVLSERELEVFQFIGQGYETREISEMLKVNIKTVQTYCTRIKEKLNLNSGSELLREAIRWNDTTLVPGTARNARG
jgi:DNA-binding NarL/FixJ family response regulator